MIPDDKELGPEESTGYRPGPLAVLITLLVILAMLTTLLWPLFYTGFGRRPTPTPIPTFLLEAHALQVIGDTSTQSNRKIKRAFHRNERLSRMQGGSFVKFCGRRVLAGTLSTTQPHFLCCWPRSVYEYYTTIRAGNKGRLCLI